MAKKQIYKILFLLNLCLMVFVLSFCTVLFLWIENQKIAQETKQYISCGVMADNNAVDYVLDSTAIAGQLLFENNCKQCHNIDNEKLTGPGLKDISRRRDEKWLIAWIQNPKKILDRKDKYATKLFEEYNKTEMPSFENLTQHEIQSILSFLNTR